MFPNDSLAPAGNEGRGPRLPGSLPRVWNLPLRNMAFTGRDDMIVTLRDRLRAGRHVVVEALHGIGGVGKTQLASSTPIGFAGGYDLCWWVDSEQPGLLGEQQAGLAVALDLVEVIYDPQDLEQDAELGLNYVYSVLPENGPPIELVSTWRWLQ
jgi:hypothetical protein